jgi:hypothetical protein
MNSTGGITITNLTLNDPSDVNQTEAFIHENMHRVSGLWSTRSETLWHQDTFQKAINEIMRKY